MSEENSIETVDLFGEKPNGERVLIGKIPMPDRMKFKEIIDSYYGSSWRGDEDGEGAAAMAMFEEFMEWKDAQNVANKNTHEK